MGKKFIFLCTLFVYVSLSLYVLFSIVYSKSEELSEPVQSALLGTELIRVKDKSESVPNLQEKKFPDKENERESQNAMTKLKCPNFIVMAANNSYLKGTPESIRRLMYFINENPNWCFVAVASGGSGIKMESSWALNECLKSRFRLLEVDSEEANDMKMIGYTFAISHGAKMVFELCQDCNVKFWLPTIGMPYLQLANFGYENVSRPVLVDKVDGTLLNSSLSFNPYFYHNLTWIPRGFPKVEFIKESLVTSKIKGQE